MKKAVAIGAISASLLGGAAVGAMLGTPALVGAQDAPTTEAPAPDASAPDQAGGWVRQALDELVADGTLTTEQADAVANKLAESRPERGPGGPGHGRRGKGPGLEAAATALGIEPSELMTQLRDGKTIAQVAADKGVDVQTVIDAMVADMSTHLDEEVAEHVAVGHVRRLLVEHRREVALEEAERDEAHGEREHGRARVAHVAAHVPARHAEERGGPLE